MLRIVSTSLLLLATIWASAQNCVPDQNITQPGFYPKSIDTAYVDTDYKQVLQIRVFEDTTVVQGGNPVVVYIDSINVLDIQGLPSGFYYTCSRSNCSFIPDSTGCATLEGKASKSQAGPYPLGIIIEVFGKVFGTISTSQKDTLDDFIMYVDDPSSVNNPLHKNISFLYPNPSFNGNVMIRTMSDLRIEQIECFNHMGQAVPFKLVDGKISLESNPNGIYFVSVLLEDGRKLTDKIQLNQ